MDLGGLNKSSLFKKNFKTTYSHFESFQKGAESKAQCNGCKNVTCPKNGTCLSDINNPAG